MPHRRTVPSAPFHFPSSSPSPSSILTPSSLHNPTNDTPAPHPIIHDPIKPSLPPRTKNTNIGLLPVNRRANERSACTRRLTVLLLCRTTLLISRLTILLCHTVYVQSCFQWSTSRTYARSAQARICVYDLSLIACRLRYHISRYTRWY